MAGVKGRSGRKPNERLWRDVLTAKAAQQTASGRTEIEELAEILWSAARQGDVTAIKEIGDRIDGKPMQAIDVSNTTHEDALGQLMGVLQQDQDDAGRSASTASTTH